MDPTSRLALVFKANRRVRASLILKARTGKYNKSLSRYDFRIKTLYHCIVLQRFQTPIINDLYCRLQPTMDRTLRC